MDWVAGWPLADSTGAEGSKMLTSGTSASPRTCNTYGPYQFPEKAPHRGPPAGRRGSATVGSGRDGA